MAINCDMVIASSSAPLGLPEVKRGVVAVAGALPRLVRVVGKQRAMEMALTGRVYSAKAMFAWGVVNKVVDTEGMEESNRNAAVVNEAIAWAQEIAGNSPDSVIVSKQGINMGWEGCGAQEATVRTRDEWFKKIEGEDNMMEGIMAFVEKRKPEWVGSKL